MAFADCADAIAGIYSFYSKLEVDGGSTVRRRACYRPLSKVLTPSSKLRVPFHPANDILKTNRPKSDEI